MTVSKILELLKNEIIKSNINLPEDFEITSIKDNCENVEKNDAFVAIKGEFFDGHDFIQTSYKRGATLFIVESEKNVPKEASYIKVKNTRKALSEIAFNFKNISSDNFKIFGVTGTNGKSTTVSLIHHLLRESKKTSTLIGTVEIKINDEVIDEPYNTTPGSLKLASILKESKDKGVEFINMEVSSHSIEQKRVENIKFDVIAYTNITRDHLDYHSTFEEYKNVKLSLVKNLKKDGKVILNIDNLKKEDLKNVDKDKVITYGFSKDADYVIKDVSKSIYQMNFKIKTPEDSELSIYSSIVGDFNAANITLALISTKLMGLSYEEIKHGIITFSGVPGRFQLVPNSKNLGFSVVIDFAHTPDALEQVLKTAKEITTGRVIIVFGAGGHADVGKRKIMGAVASKYADITILTTDDPKDDDPEKIIEDVKKGIDVNKNFIVIPNRRTAINAAINFANREDIVIIAGRGHELFQLFAKGKKVKFNDFEVAHEIIENLRRSMKK